MLEKIFKKNKYPCYISKVYFTEKQITREIKKAAKWIDENFKDKNPLAIIILKGATPFFGQLYTKVKIDLACDFVVVSSYKGEITPQSKPDIVLDLHSNVEGRNLIIIEDIVDTGRTMSLLKDYLLKNKKANSVTIMTLVDKPEARKMPLKVDYTCTVISDESFLIGYGLDFNEHFRNLPYIAEFDKNYISQFKN